MDLRVSADVSLNHGLFLTTELRQGIAVLQMSATDLVDYVGKCLEENPFLDCDDWSQPGTPYDRERFRRDFSSDELLERRGHGSPERFDGERADMSQRAFSFDRFLTEEASLEDYLIAQLGMQTSDKRLLAIGEYLIGSIDENGYLGISIESVVSALAAHEDEVRRALSIVQRLDPAGIGAACLADCLSIQLEAKGAMTPLLRDLINNHLSEFATRTPAAIASGMGVPLSQIIEALDAIRSCNPRPAAQFGRCSQPVWPEIMVERAADGSFTVRLLDVFLPSLRINDAYRTLAFSARGKTDADKYLKDKLAEAESLLDNLSYRKTTLYRVACCIAEYQVNFFERGYEGLRPLTMTTVAKEAGVSESTVSRVSNGNYMQTPQGVFELRFFFQSALRGGDDGISSADAKRRIKTIIGEEDSSHPLSDRAIADALAKQGVNISRRTVNKYREELGIPTRSARRRA